MSLEKVRVLIEVSGGVVQNIVAGSFVDAVVVDWDNLADAPADEWAALPEWTQKRLRKLYPEECALLLGPEDTNVTA